MLNKKYKTRRLSFWKQPRFTLRTMFASVLSMLLVSYSIAGVENEQTVERFIQAFNEKNIDAMLDASLTNIRWMRVVGSDISTETAGHEALRQSLSEYFNSTPSARSEVRSINASGNFVYTLEQAFWVSKGVEKSQCSMAIYELESKKILNVWYFQEHTC